MEKIEHLGNLATKTIFRLDDRSLVSLNVWYKTEATCANTRTYYICELAIKGKGCRNWSKVFSSTSALDSRFFDYVSSEQLYQAYYNHWFKLNPIRMFGRSVVNGVLGDFQVEERIQDKIHKCY